MKLFCNILPGLQNQVGHIFQYSLSTQRATEQQSWVYIAWIPTDCEITPIPLNWTKNLPQARRISSQTTINRLGEPIRYFLAFRKAIRGLKKEKETIFFLEHFRLPQLFSLFLALVFSNLPFQVWLLHRYATEQMCLKGQLHKILYKSFCFFRGKNSLRFISDSELLSQEQSKLFGHQVITLPIPHARVSVKEKFSKDPNFIYCWWPGGATRESKGLKEMCSLSKLLEMHSCPLIKLILARNALAKGIQFSPSILSVEDEMDRTTYEKWLNTADIALLPYAPADYRLSTSGIFVEAVANGLIPITSKNTWMAYELQKHNLSDLVVNWASPSILERVSSIAQDLEIKKKLKNMQKIYQKYHSVEAFSNLLRTI